MSIDPDAERRLDRLNEQHAGLVAVCDSAAEFWSDHGVVGVADAYRAAAEAWRKVVDETAKARPVIIGCLGDPASS